MLPTSRTLVRLVAAAALAAAASAVVPTAPASAATCPTATGVSVVVDFHELGGGVRTTCVADGAGQRASSLFPAAGFPLTYVQRQPGFVCRVSGVPADDPCVNTPPADAYWGLWWSDGKSGSWNYASTGAAGVTVPGGGYVAFSWNGSSARSAPGTDPATHTTPPTPTHAPTHPPTPPPSSPTSQPSHAGQPGAPGQVGQPTKPPGGTGGEMLPEDPSPSATTDRPGTAKHDRATASATPEASTPTPSATPGPADDALPAASDADDQDGRLPAWVAPVAIVLLFAGAGGAAVVRRRRGSPGP